MIVLDISTRHCLFEVGKRAAAGEHKIGDLGFWVHTHMGNNF